MIDFSLTEEQVQLQELARKFAREEIIPKAAYHDHTGEFPREIVKKAWEIGLMNTHVPVEYGGAGLGVLDGCLITEAVSYTHLRAHETRHDLVCRLLLEKKKK